MGYGDLPANKALCPRFLSPFSFRSEKNREIPEMVASPTRCRLNQEWRPVRPAH
jgi:hypothetical protein